MTTQTALPAWDQMSDLDKGAALLHMHKVQREGPAYATDNYPCRYLDNEQLSALSTRAASLHARQVTGSNRQVFDRIGTDEYFRLYNLALYEENRRWMEKQNGDA